jgi:2-dehydro-3-deoxygluconokinase
MQAANAANVPVFFDLNYRSKLWSIEDARACFVELAPMIDVLFAGRGSMGTFFGIEGDHETVMRAARTKLGVAACVLTRKKAKASRAIKLRSMAVGSTDTFVETPWRSVEIVDRLGGGDAFAGGFIAGYLEDSQDLTRAVNLGLAASALKHTVPGDFLAASRAEIEAAAIADEVAVLQR